MSMLKRFNLAAILMTNLSAPAQPFTAAWYRETIQGVHASTRRRKSRRFKLGLRRAPSKRYLADALNNEVVYTSAAESLRALFNAGLAAVPLDAPRFNTARRLSDGGYHPVAMPSGQGLCMIVHVGSGLILDRPFKSAGEAAELIDRLTLVPELVQELGLLKPL